MPTHIRLHTDTALRKHHHDDHWSTLVEQEDVSKLAGHFLFVKMHTVDMVELQFIHGKSQPAHATAECSLAEA